MVGRFRVGQQLRFKYEEGKWRTDSKSEHEAPEESNSRKLKAMVVVGDKNYIINDTSEEWFELTLEENGKVFLKINDKLKHDNDGEVAYLVTGI